MAIVSTKPVRTWSEQEWEQWVEHCRSRRLCWIKQEAPTPRQLGYLKYAKVPSEVRAFVDKKETTHLIGQLKREEGQLESSQNHKVAPVGWVGSGAGLCNAPDHAA